MCVCMTTGIQFSNCAPAGACRDQELFGKFSVGLPAPLSIEKHNRLLVSQVPGRLRMALRNAGCQTRVKSQAIHTSPARCM
jgi:hypothetical protein